MTVRRRLISATELAAEEVRELIHSGSLAPGERIEPDELAQSLQLSRTPIRDALQALKTEGLVEVIPRVGFFVRKISEGEAQDVYAIKAAIEPLAAAWAAERGSDEEKQRLAKLLAMMQESAAANDVDRCAECVDSLHMYLLEMASSQPLYDAYRVIVDRVKLLRYLNMAQAGRLEVSVRQHTEIVDAVVAGDSTLASKSMKRHMLDAAKSVQAVLRARS